ncbi:unnamed protein product [Eretmochelys imbricata]
MGGRERSTLPARLVSNTATATLQTGNDHTLPGVPIGYQGAEAPNHRECRADNPAMAEGLVAHGKGRGQHWSPRQTDGAGDVQKESQTMRAWLTHGTADEMGQGMGMKPMRMELEVTVRKEMQQEEQRRPTKTQKKKRNRERGRNGKNGEGREIKAE